MLLYPSKCCELGSVAQLLPLSLSCTWTHFESLNELRVRQSEALFFQTNFLTQILKNLFPQPYLGGEE
jgi:hypothetical protein